MIHVRILAEVNFDVSDDTYGIDANDLDAIRRIEEQNAVESLIFELEGDPTHPVTVEVTRS